MGRSATNNRVRCVLLAALVIPFLASVIVAAAIDTSKLPPSADMQIDFARDIQPIFQQSCIKCHGEERPKSRFSLSSRESALKGGSAGVDIIPGNGAASPLVHYVARLVEEMQMPPPDRGEPLTSEQVGLLRAWIDQGATWNTNALSEFQFSITPTLRWIGINGDGKKFREIEGLKEGWGGGLQELSLRERVSPDTLFTAEARALFREQDFRLQLGLDKTDFGFIRGGFEVWRKYYDDTGVFATNAAVGDSFNLGRDLHMDIGRAWFDVGLNLPDSQKVVLGYEYQFKQGDKSTLQWGQVGTLPPFDPDTDAKNIYPASKHIDEGVHIIKLDLNHEIGGWHFGDNARVEFYRLETSRQNANITPTSISPAPDTFGRVDERTTYTQGMNVLSLYKQLADWLSVSSGYLYSRLEGDAAFNQNTYTGSGAFTFGPQWFANTISLERESHVTSVGGLIGPWSGLMLSVGVQGEWTRQESLGNEDLQFGDPGVPALFSDPSLVIGKMNSTSARENVLLRYTRIPWTVLYAEARLKQESLGRFEERPDGSQPFTRDTDADINQGEYRVGFNTSPWPRVSLAGSFKHSLKETDYSHLELLNSPGYGYPGFILWREIEDNQIQARLVWRTASWLRTSFNYRYQETDFTDSTADVDFLTEGGPIEAASQRAHVYSVNTVFTPVRRLYLSGTFSYTDSRAVAAHNDLDSVVPYEGDVYSVWSAATFSLNPKTDLKLAYGYSRSDYRQNNGVAGLPAGINYELHNLQAGVTRRLTKNVTSSLIYGFSLYHEPTSGGGNDYTAHGVFASATVSWP